MISNDILANDSTPRVSEGFIGKARGEKRPYIPEHVVNGSRPCIDKQACASTTASAPSAQIEIRIEFASA